MKPLRIFIDPAPAGPLSAPEIRYTLETLLEIAGYPCRFEADAHGCDIVYAKQLAGKPALFLQMENVGRQLLKRPRALTRLNNIPFFSFSDPTAPIRRAQHNGTVEISADIVLASFYFLTGQEEPLIPRNSDDHHRLRESYAFQHQLNYVPIVDLYAGIIRDTFSAKQEPLAPWPNGKKFAIALSHDIDYPEMIRWVECLRYLARKNIKSDPRVLLKIASGGESFWQFDEITALERDLGFRSSFFFCGFNRGSLFRHVFKAPDPFYDIEKKHFVDLFKRLTDQNFEIGMHASFLTSESEALFVEEKNRVEKVLGAPVLGNRQHYFRVNPAKPAATFHMEERAGLVYDSSLAFEEKGGFRRGAASPFRPYNPEAGTAFKLLEICPTQMDDHLFGYRRNNETGSWKSEIDLLLSAVRGVGGLCTLVYHPRTLNTTFYPEWGDSFRYWLQKAAGSTDCYCDTLINISNWRNERLAKLKKFSQH